MFWTLKQDMIKARIPASCLDLDEVSGLDMADTSSGMCF